MNPLNQETAVPGRDSNRSKASANFFGEKLRYNTWKITEKVELSL
jgi:hypothetical protein